jgi:hypothetical protein
VLSTPYENRPPDVRVSGADGEDAQ